MMLPAMLRSQWGPNKKALLFGLAFGILWGFLTAASATPSESLLYDEVQGVIYKYLDGSPTAVLQADKFFTEFNLTLIQITLTYLALVAPAGWATWQLTRIRPRGSQQPPLWPKLDWYLIGLTVGGLATVGLFQKLGWAIWFKGALFTPARIVSIGLGILLPLYMGGSLFLVWFWRLPSARAPNWETAYPKPPMRSGKPFWARGFKLRKGGDPTNN
jgi:hypothetical protein